MQQLQPATSVGGDRFKSFKGPAEWPSTNVVTFRDLAIHRWLQSQRKYLERYFLLVGSTCCERRTLKEQRRLTTPEPLHSSAAEVLAAKNGIMACRFHRVGSWVDNDVAFQHLHKIFWLFRLATFFWPKCNKLAATQISQFPLFGLGKKLPRSINLSQRKRFSPWRELHFRPRCHTFLWLQKEAHDNDKPVDTIAAQTAVFPQSKSAFPHSSAGKRPLPGANQVPQLFKNWNHF